MSRMDCTYPTIYRASARGLRRGCTEVKIVPITPSALHGRDWTGARQSTLMCQQKLTKFKGNADS
jgi:hypothetical protein